MFLKLTVGGGSSEGEIILINVENINAIVSDPKSYFKEEKRFSTTIAMQNQFVYKIVESIETIESLLVRKGKVILED
jgi:hypothetical protein